MAERRAYNWRIVTYTDEESIIKFCKQWGSKWEYIKHDKDIKEDGSPKELHYHINITLKEWKSCKKVCELIGGEGNSFAIEMTDKERAHRYLTHADNPEKYQYEEQSIVSNFKWVDGKAEKATTEEFLKIAENNKLSMREKAVLLGRDYIKNYKAYKSYIEDMRLEELKKGSPYVERVIRYIIFKCGQNIMPLDIILEETLRIVREQEEELLSYYIEEEEEEENPFEVKVDIKKPKRGTQESFQLEIQKKTNKTRADKSGEPSDGTEG